ncbi:MAG: tetratricopeptide repeat protein [Betaproteobacteria bacterium]
MDPVAVKRGGVLAVLLVALVPAFAFTSLVTRLYHQRERVLAEDWLRRGEAALGSGRPDEAVDDLRTALVFSHEAPSFRLRLVDALVQANHPVEAHAQLTTLLDQQPGSGTINLQLARLAARAGDLQEAARYYDSAINGIWDANAEERRRAVRLEFASWLLQRGEPARAQAQLIALSADLPPGSPLETQVGQMLVDAGSPRRASELFADVLRRNPRDPAALEGAGVAAFQLGDYAAARRHLAAAAQTHELSPGRRDMLETATSVLTLNPFARRLSSAERSRRSRSAFGIARARLSECAQTAGVNLDDPESTDEMRALSATADQLEPQLRPPAFARDSDLLDSVMTLVFRVETATAARCGQPRGADLALLLLGREGRNSDQ